MPELPEVETVVVTLRPRVVGQTIADVVVRRADVITPKGFDFRAKLRGRTIASIDRRGKRIVFTLSPVDDGRLAGELVRLSQFKTRRTSSPAKREEMKTPTLSERFYIHLGMTGRLTIEPPGAELLKHTHVVLKFSNFDVRFRDPRRFGGVWWIGPADAGDGMMGPEPLDLRPGQLHGLLAKTQRAVKVALLDQHLVAGLGNIYVDEGLFAAGIHPLTPANRISAEQAATLTRAIKTVLKRAIRSRGSSLRDYVDANGVGGGFQKLHHVYDRKGQPCRGCTTPIERIVLGGRSTHFCPNCQPRSVKRKRS